LTRLEETLEPTDWTTLFRAFADALEWAFDRAADLARDYPHEVAIVERVRTFARRRIAGDPAHVRIEDVLFVFGLFAGAIERQLGERRAATPLTGYLRARKATIGTIHRAARDVIRERDARGACPDHRPSRPDR
jgi:hypothetical protein